MKLEQRIEVILQLGDYLRSNDEALQHIIEQTYFHNRWFIKENTNQAIKAITNNFLQKKILHNWLKSYALGGDKSIKKIGLILAGNIPLVGFHDLLCVFLAGHKSLVKLSEKDKFLIPHLIEKMKSFDPKTDDYFEIIERLKGFDAVIATGSNNSARYFESYFGKYPNIIRKNRNAVAVLTGNESVDQLNALGTDVFQYFGLGCRNVSKLYLPKPYNFHPLLEAFHEYRDIVLHDKYKNNFDYGFTLLILNKIPYEANGCILMTEDPSLHSKIAQLHYEYYDNEADLAEKLESKKNEIQCVVGDDPKYIPFGEAQNPGLGDYADGVDTIDFLLNISNPN